MSPSSTFLLKRVAPFWAALLLFPLLFHPRIPAQKILVNVTPDRRYPGDSGPFVFGANKSFAFFWAGEDAGKGFWRTDGTEAGTLRLLSQFPGKSKKGKPTGLAWANQFFFRGWDPQAGWELFKTDGSLKGTRLVKDLDPRRDNQRAPLSSEPRHFTILGNALFFVADTEKGTTLFRSDGTGKGTNALFSVQGEIQNLTPLGPKLVFQITGNISLQNGLAVSDGTSRGTHLIFRPFRMDSGRGSQAFATLGNLVFFAAEPYFSSPGMELFVSDGTSKGTRILKDIWPGPNGSKPTHFERVGAQVFFSADHPKFGRELWRTNGTAKGTALVKDINPQFVQGFGLSSNPTNFQAFGNKLLFQAETIQLGKEPWISDGTAKGTLLLKDLAKGLEPSHTSSFLPLGTKAFFLSSPNSKTYSLFQTDGTPKGTQVVTDLGLPLDPNSEPRLIPYGNQFLFPNWDPKHGLEPWISNGTKNGTHLLKDLVPTRWVGNSSNPRHFKALGNKLYFSTEVYGTNNNLWETDVTGKNAHPISPIGLGTIIQKAGNRLIWLNGPRHGNKLLAYDPIQKKVLSLLTTQGRFSRLYPLGDKWLFTENSSNASTTKIWVTDGTTKGTHLVPWIQANQKDAWMPSVSFGRRGVIAGPVYNSLPRKSFPVWISDGSQAGTRILTTVTSPLPIRGVYFNSTTRLGKEFVFALTFWDRTHHYRTHLYRTDGSPAGTTLLKALDFPNFGSLQTLGTKVLFRTWEKKYGSELWVSDGTPKGTRLLKDLYPGPEGSIPTALRRVGDKIVFVARTPGAGWEIFVSDGTTKGTGLLKDLLPGKGSGLGQLPQLISVGSRKVVFLGRDGRGGIRFWVSDGTVPGTKPVTPPIEDPILNPRLGDPTFVQGRLFYGWSTQETGTEPWVWFLGASARAYGFGCGTEPTLHGSDPVTGGSMSLEGILPTQQPTAALLFGSKAQFPLRMGGGCLLYVDPFRLTVSVPIQGRLGKWKIKFPVPNQPSLRGLLFQAQVLHPLKAGGFDLSNPVECVLGN